MTMTSSEAGTLSRVYVRVLSICPHRHHHGVRGGVCRGRVQTNRLSGWASPTTIKAGIRIQEDSGHRGLPEQSLGTHFTNKVSRETGHQHSWQHLGKTGFMLSTIWDVLFTICDMGGCCQWLLVACLHPWLACLPSFLIIFILCLWVFAWAPSMFLASKELLCECWEPSTVLHKSGKCSSLWGRLSSLRASSYTRVLPHTPVTVILTSQEVLVLKPRG